MWPDIAAKHPTLYEFIQKHKIMLFLAVLFTAKLIFQIYLFREGFLSVSADEFSRGIKAMNWAKNPYWVLGAAGWLPFELYLNGLALMLCDHVILVPRITAFLASCWLLYFFFRLTHYLFSEYMVAVLSTVILACFPWYVWLSGTPMLDIYYMAFIVSGFYFLCIWLKEQKSGYLFWGGLSFFISSGFHYQSWVVVNSILLLTVFFLFGYFKNREFGKIKKMIIFYFFCNAYVILMSAATFVQTGSIATVFAKHSNYSKWFYHGYELSAFSKFMHYPKLLLDSTNILFHILFLVSLYFLFKEKDRLWKVICGAAGCFVLIFFSLFNIFSVPATAAPGRFVLPFFTLFSPYVAYSIYRLYARQRMNVLKPAVICLFVLLLLPGIRQSLHFPKGMSQDSVKAGEYLNGLLDRPDFGKSETYMLEVVYWDFLGVNLTAKHYSQMVPDREINKFKRNIPSLFSKDIAAIYHGLLQNNTRYVALRNEELKSKASRLGTIEKEIGDWTIFKIKR
jgi:hypothetical protein